MPFPQDNLNIYLWFEDELKQVRIMVVGNDDGFQLLNMGTIQDKGLLREVLEKAGIDYIIYQRREDSAYVADKANPKSIISRIEKAFEMNHNIEDRIINGEHVTDDEKSFISPLDVHLCSSSVKPEKGLKLIKRMV
jgi:hypothetical protein